MSESAVPHIEQEDQGFTRRGFVKVALGGVGLAYAAAIGYPIYRYLNSPVEASIAMAAVKEVTLPDADKLPKGSALMYKFGVRPAMLIHHKDDTWVSLDAVCTHMGCTVAYDPNADMINCACHGGKYDAKTGENVSGPPPRPLTRYEVTVSPGSVLVQRA
ncbi:MAG: Rieske (2Fe-2S) protein [Armatimonadetes bacterium]|nr:Rieske (2Fe-2S) protein [Armatimonadota bacterium]